MQKMNEIDFSKAPAGATHYFRVSECSVEWWLLSGVVAFCYSDGKYNDGKYNHITDPPIEMLKPIPPKPWDGKGFPPVGTRCEVFYHGSWEKTLVVGCDQYDTHLPVFKTDWRPDLRYDSGFTKFRPLRSKEDEAKKAIIHSMGGSVSDESYIGTSILEAIKSGKIPHIKWVE
jgi:hypothetical protein